MSSPEHVSAVVAEIAETLPYAEAVNALEHTANAAAIIDTAGGGASPRLSEIAGQLREARVTVGQASSSLLTAGHELARYAIELVLGEPAGAVPVASPVHGERLSAPPAPPPMRMLDSELLLPQEGSDHTRLAMKVMVAGREERVIDKPQVHARPYYTTWQRFKAAGLPVPSDVYLIRVESNRPAYPNEWHNRRVIIPDVKADGSEVYGDQLARSMKPPVTKRGITVGGQESERRHRDIDPLFLQATSPENFPSIEARVRELQRTLDEHGLYVSGQDGYKLVVHPDGSWDIVMEELQAAGRERAQAPHEFNRGVANAFLHQIRCIRMGLRGHSVTPPAPGPERRAWLREYDQ